MPWSSPRFPVCGAAACDAVVVGGGGDADTVPSDEPPVSEGLPQWGRKGELAGEEGSEIRVLSVFRTVWRIDEACSGGELAGGDL